MRLIQPQNRYMIREGMKLVLAGDSTVAQNHGLSSDADAISQEDTGNGLTLLQAELGHPFVFNVAKNYGTSGSDAHRVGHNKGVSGDKIQDLLDRLDDDVLDLNPGIVSTSILTNDVAAGTDSVYVLFEKAQTLTERILNSGAVYMPGLIYPRNTADGSSDWDNDAERQMMLHLNDMLWAYWMQLHYMGNKILPVDTFSPLVDRLTNNYDAITGATKDSVHLSNVGAHYVMEAHKAALAPFNLKNLKRGWEGLAQYDANGVEYGNLLPDLSGTGGNTDDGSTGDVAADWRMDMSSGANTAMACSKVSAPDGGTDPWQQIVLTCTGAGAGLETARFRPDPVTNTNTLAGEWYTAQLQIDVEECDDAGLEKSMYIKIDDSTSPDRDVYGGLLDSGDEPLPRAKKQRTIRTPYWQAQNDGDSFAWEFRMGVDASVSGSTTIKLGRPVMKRVPAPDFN